MRSLRPLPSFALKKARSGRSEITLLGAGTPRRPKASAATRSKRDPTSAGLGPSRSRCAARSLRACDGEPMSSRTCSIAPAASSAPARWRERSPAVRAVTALMYWSRNPVRPNGFLGCSIQSGAATPVLSSSPPLTVMTTRCRMRERMLCRLAGDSPVRVVGS